MINVLPILSPGDRICLDTSVLIYYFNRHDPYFDTCRQIVRAIEFGSLKGVLSVVSEMELLVAPVAGGRSDVVLAITDLLRRLSEPVQVGS